MRIWDLWPVLSDSQVVSPDLFYVQTSLTVVRDLENLSSSIAENDLQPLTGAMVRLLPMHFIQDGAAWSFSARAVFIGSCFDMVVKCCLFPTSVYITIRSAVWIISCGPIHFVQWELVLQLQCAIYMYPTIPCGSLVAGHCRLMVLWQRPFLVTHSLCVDLFFDVRTAVE